MQEIVDIYGNRQPLFDFTWPVFEMRMMPLPEYIDLHWEKEGKDLLPDVQHFFQSVESHIKHATVICPIYEGPVRLLTSLDEWNLFQSFADISAAPGRKKDRLIQSWVNKYGLPFYAVKSALSFQTENYYDPVLDQVCYHAKKIETGLYRSFDRFVMLKETFLALSLEAHFALEIHKAKNLDINKYRILLNPYEFEQATTESGVSREKNEKRRFDILHAILQRRLKGHTASMYPIISPKITKKPPYVKYDLRFKLPDLLTAMWVQFLDIITRKMNIGQCPVCNSFFIPRREGQKFCNPEPGKVISRCRSKYNKRLHDHPEQRKDDNE